MTLPPTPGTPPGDAQRHGMTPEERLLDWRRWHYARDEAQYDRLHAFMEGVLIIAFFPGALVLHWFLVESWWAWALTAPVVALAGFGYMLFKAAQVGPGRASDRPLLRLCRGLFARAALRRPVGAATPPAEPAAARMISRAAAPRGRETRRGSRAPRRRRRTRGAASAG